MSELDRIITLPVQPAMTLQPRIAVQSPGDATARQIPFWRAVEDVVRASGLIEDPASYGVGVYELDGSDFDGVTTTFPNLLPVEPDLTDGKTVLINLTGVNVLRRVTGTPGTFEFRLDGATNQDVTFGAAPNAGDVAQVVLSRRTSATPTRYIYLCGFVGVVQDNAIPFGWVIPEGISGVIEAGAVGCTAAAITDATSANAVMELTKNGTPFGTVTFSTAGTATFSVTAETTVAPHDVLYPINPSPANATLAGVMLSLRVKLDG